MIPGFLFCTLPGLIAMSRKLVEPLIEHLRSTGTGQEKLATVAEVAEQVSSPDEFMATIAERVPPGTLAKIKGFANANWAKKETPKLEPSPAAPPEVVVPKAKTNK